MVYSCFCLAEHAVSLTHILNTASPETDGQMRAQAGKNTGNLSQEEGLRSQKSFPLVLSKQLTQWCGVLGSMGVRDADSEHACFHVRRQRVTYLHPVFSRRRHCVSCVGVFHFCRLVFICFREQNDMVGFRRSSWSKHRQLIKEWKTFMCRAGSELDLTREPNMRKF